MNLVKQETKVKEVFGLELLHTAACTAEVVMHSAVVFAQATRRAKTALGGFSLSPKLLMALRCLKTLTVNEVIMALYQLLHRRTQSNFLRCSGRNS